MKLNKIAKKSIAIFTVLLLILSFNISTNVSAELIPDYEYGVAYDEFGDDTSIDLQNCTYDEKNASVILEYGPVPVLYDHDKKPDNIEAWYHDEAYITPGGDVAQILSLLIHPNLLPSEEFENLAPIDEARTDNSYLETESVHDRFLQYTYYPLHLFKIEIEENINRLEDFTVNWWSGPFDEYANIDEITMYMWTYGDFIPYWNRIEDPFKYTEENFNQTNGIISSEESADRFISEEGVAHILIVGKPKTNTNTSILTTDYVNIELSTKEGYHPEGYVTSDTIPPLLPDPSKFYGWESIIWESSKPTEDSYVKLQVLDNDGELIETLDGNSDGFLTSPIDLSSLGADYSSIRLKATLHSEKYDVTPRLNSWAVLWQTTNGFFDNFNLSFRISESYGVDIKFENVTISKFYSEWPIFGKNPANTRSYIGPDVEYEGNKTYWQTYIDKDVAGWFRSPVMSDGLVYVGANDKKIYAFNLSLDPTKNENAYSPIDESSADYEVETAVAVDDEYVIVGTSTLDTTDNKIYALSITNLSFEKWNYSIGGSKTNCFTAAPTISDGNVYVTSWSGKFANSPIIAYLYSKLNALLNYDLLNNKLIALDLITGYEKWEPIDLPDASLSTPAVDNGLIFVGCENIGGPSVFAFDEETGDEVWNASVGTVGRASPVVAEGEDGKIVIVVVREQTPFSYAGTDKVVALNAEDGSVLWNFTIGNQSTLLRGFSLRFKDFANLKATSPPAATPAVFEDTVYVASASGIVHALDLNTGAEKWRFEDSVTLSYHTTSPAVVKNEADDVVYVYILSQNAYLYVLDSNGNLILEYPIVYEGYDFIAFGYASPIVTDGLVIISIIDWLITGEYYGHLMCLGEYTKNLVGKIYSVPIHVQKGKWWNEFNAECDNTEENNTITFTILDENGGPLISGLNGTHNNISSIKGDVIQLCAEFNIGNASEPLPVLKSWQINWTTEDKAPVFDGSSFRAGEGQEGWINIEDLPECSINVKDYGVGGIISGLDVDSAKFTLRYVSTSDTTVTKTFNAVCDGESGDEQVKVIAKISELDIKIKELKNITFNIKDLAGNSADPHNETFKTDTVKPTSEIIDKETFEDKYNSEVLISAEGEDDKSGVASIALYYRIESATTWTQHGSTVSPYDWLFKNDTSGYYELCSIATDKAGNSEDFPDYGEISFLFDMNKPSKPDFAEEYPFDTLPEFSITFLDDYQLESVDYRLDFHGTDDWTLIGSNLYDKSYTGEWSLSQDDWDTMLEDVTYYMYFKITDFGGNQYLTPSDGEALRLIKDVMPTTIVDIDLGLSDFEEGGWDDEFTITAEVPDHVEVKYISLRYSYSSDNSKWSDWKDYGDDLTDEPFEWDFKAEEGSGYYKFKTIITDAEGGIVESLAKTVNITIFPTTLVLLLVIIIIILLGISVFVIRKTKKK